MTNPPPTSKYRRRLLFFVNVVAIVVAAALLLTHGDARQSVENAFLLFLALAALGALSWSLSSTARLARAKAFALWSFAVFIAVVFVLGACEALARVIDLGGISFYAESERYQTLATIPNLALRYKHRIGFRGRLDKVEVVINSRGLRDHERPLDKSAGTYRILVLGDSVPFGWGVPLEQTFTKLMETKLNALNNGKHYDVINTGVCSYDTRDEVEYFKREGVRYEPDCVLLFFVPNDLNTILDRRTGRTVKLVDDSGPPSVRAMISLEKRSFIAQIIAHRFAVAPTAERARRFDPQSSYWRAARDLLLDLRDRCREMKIPLVLFGVCGHDGERGRRALKRLREFAREADVPLFDCDDFFRAVDYRKFVNSQVDPHWNGAGHERATNGIIDNLRKLRIVGESAKRRINKSANREQ